MNVSICRAGASITEWLDRNIDYWPLMPRHCVEKLCKEKYEGTAVVSEVETVCGSGPLGMKLFGFALKQVLAEHLASVIEQEVKDTVSGKQIGTEEVVDCKQNCLLKVDAMKNIKSIPDRRDILVT